MKDRPFEFFEALQYRQKQLYCDTFLIPHSGFAFAIIELKCLNVIRLLLRFELNHFHATQNQNAIMDYYKILHVYRELKDKLLYKTKGQYERSRA